jgi:hypothetical protein
MCGPAPKLLQSVHVRQVQDPNPIKCSAGKAAIPINSRPRNCDSIMLFLPIRIQMPAPENSSKTKHEARNGTEPAIMHHSLSCSIVDIAGLKG